MTHPMPFTTPTLALPNSITWSSLRRHFFVGTLAVVFACFALSPTARGQDGDELNGNTAEGRGALYTYITTGNLVTSNTAIGFNALYSDTTGGSNNTATGVNALRSNTSGSNNTATGIAALANNTTGSANTAMGSGALDFNNADNNTGIGFDALTDNTTGANNTAVGKSALFSNTNGSDNTAIGYHALFSNGFDAIDNTAMGSGALSSSNSGSFNTAIGFNALFSNTASNNTAIGDQALLNNTSGTENTATGAGTLFKNTTGNNNTANGLEALFSNTTGSNNTADGLLALENNTGGHDNIAEGFQALANNTTGSSNIALGSNAGINLTTGSNNIDIGAPGTAGESKKIRIGKQGTQTATFIAGIYNVNEGGTIKPLYINSNGQLGTQAPASARRFKKEIKPMDQTSEAILALKPVTFHYNSDSQDTPQFGLIAEEVAKVNPDLVVRDDDGEIYTVRYEAVNAMLLNEFLKEHRKVEEQRAYFESKLVEQQKQIEALTATVQKVSDQLALSRPAPQLVAELK
jgi:trimeric autotransporter adhesin